MQTTVDARFQNLLAMNIFIDLDRKVFEVTLSTRSCESAACNCIYVHTCIPIWCIVLDNVLSQIDPLA